MDSATDVGGDLKIESYLKSAHSTHLALLPLQRSRSIGRWIVTASQDSRSRSNSTKSARTERAPIQRPPDAAAVGQIYVRAPFLLLAMSSHQHLLISKVWQRPWLMRKASTRQGLEKEGTWSQHEINDSVYRIGNDVTYRLWRHVVTHNPPMGYRWYPHSQPKFR